MICMINGSIFIRREIPGVLGGITQATAFRIYFLTLRAYAFV